MRAAATLAILTAALPVQAAPCVWDELGIPPLRNHNGPLLQRSYTCPGNAQGTLRIVMTATAGDNTVALVDKTETIKPQGRFPQSGRIREMSGRYGMCKAGPGKTVQRRLDGEAGAQRVSYAVTVRAEISGTGDLAGLTWRGNMEALCPLCDGKSGSIALMEGRAQVSRMSGKTRVIARLDRAWFECARWQSDLALRFFADAGEIEAASSIRPIHVEAHLEKRLTRQGEELVLDEPAPLTALCKAAGAGTHSMLWEVFGAGELMRIGGGGRSAIEVRCP